MKKFALSDFEVEFLGHILSKAADMIETDSTQFDPESQAAKLADLQIRQILELKTRIGVS